jgi:type VI secretion system protein ImpL
VDPQFHIESVTQSLLIQPMDHAQALIKMGPKEALNGGGRKLCAQLAQITGKFPFNANSTQDVAIDQMNALLAPNAGELWKFYAANLAQFLPKQGTRYIANPGGSVKISPEFEAFFNRAAALSDAIYPSGSPAPHMAFSLKQISTNIEGLSLKIGPDTLSGTGQQKTFTWSGAPEDVQVVARDLPINNYASGPWAVFRFLNDGHPQNKNGNTTEVSYTVRQSNGQEVMRNGQKEFYTYDLQFGGANVRLSDFSGLSCVSQVAH